MNRRNGETENRRRAVAASPARSPRRLPPDDFGDAFGVNQHQLGVSEEDNFAIVLRGAEVPRLAKGVLGPVGEPDSERPERFSFRDLFESDCVHGCKLPPPPARANNKTKREKRAHPSGRGGLHSVPHVVCLLLLAFGLSAHAARFSVDWWTVDGGAVNCAGPRFAAVGTIGQPDATAMSGATFSVEGGFWNSDITLLQLLDQITGTVELEAFRGVTRAVTFKATDTGGVVRKTWTVSLSFAGGSTASYALTDVPLDTVSLSAKTDWNLRRKLGVSFTNNAAVANFTGPKLLPAGDLDNSNTVNLADYYVVASVWYTSAPSADLDGSGFVDLDDYFLLANHWQAVGDAE